MLCVQVRWGGLGQEGGRESLEGGEGMRLGSWWFPRNFYSPLFCSVLDVKAFERLLGPCKEIMKRNFELYKQQLHELFGSSLGIGDEEA